MYTGIRTRTRTRTPHTHIEQSMYLPEDCPGCASVWESLKMRTWDVYNVLQQAREKMPNNPEGARKDLEAYKNRVLRADGLR